MNRGHTVHQHTPSSAATPRDRPGPPDPWATSRSPLQRELPQKSVRVFSEGRYLGWPHELESETGWSMTVRYIHRVHRIKVMLVAERGVHRRVHHGVVRGIVPKSKSVAELVPHNFLPVCNR